MCGFFETGKVPFKIKPLFFFPAKIIQNAKTDPANIEFSGKFDPVEYYLFLLSCLNHRS
jgi:hypothetical protein